jgi:hypothetical protein
MSVTCVDCNNEFTDEAWLEHDNSLDCYRESKAKRVVTVASLAQLGWLIGALALVGGLTVYDRVINPSEDSGNLLLNCYAYGDGDCGPNAPWHGFINIP